MEKTLPLNLGTSVIGSVVCSCDSFRTKLFAKTYVSISGICRAYVRGQGGSILIGVLAPDGTCFSAEKNLSNRELSGLGLNFDEITYAYALKTEEGSSGETCLWHPLKEIPDLLCRDEVIFTLASSTNALCDNPGAPTAIAVPLAADRPFPCPDVLCIVSPRQINGSLYGVVGVSEKGFAQKY